VIGTLGIRKWMRDDQVDNCGWEEETDDTVGAIEARPRCNGTKVMCRAKMTWKQGEVREVIGRGVGTQHRWNCRGAKWCRWRKKRRGYVTGGIVSGGKVWEDNRERKNRGKGQAEVRESCKRSASEGGGGSGKRY
jgi:hypothetical protein